MSASAILALLAPIAASASATVSYDTGAPPCTTKSTQPNANIQRPNLAANDGWLLPMGPHYGMSPERSRDMVDRYESGFVVSSQAFPTASSFVDAPKTTPALPATIADGKSGLVVSTCASDVRQPPART
jgi:hypothetical protein